MDKRVLSVLLLAVVIGLFASIVAAQDYPKISYRDAADHLGEIRWVEGMVLNTETTDQGVFLVFSNQKKYLRVVVPTEFLGNFKGGPKYLYGGKKIQAVGTIVQRDDQLLLGVDDPSRIKVVSE
ncbi:MAG TPA: hypothetical protein VJB88_03690 [Vicinamibacteria bacterium]|nr:hypothetical protein [Vicinamibacteria bacterium]